MSLNARNYPKGKRFSTLHDLLATLRAAGIQPEVRRARGSHVLISWHDTAGTRRAVSVGMTSGEWHHANARRQLRHILKGLPA
jgi:hypothetical protein